MLKPMAVTNTRRHYIMKEITMQEEDAALINIYRSNTGTPRYIKQVTLKMRETDNNTIKSRT